MPPKPIDLSDILRPYIGKWVAMTQDRSEVIASASTFKAVLRAVRRKRPPYLPLVMKVPDRYVPWVMIGEEKQFPSC